MSSIIPKLPTDGLSIMETKPSPIMVVVKYVSMIQMLTENPIEAIIKGENTQFFDSVILVDPYGS